MVLSLQLSLNSLQYRLNIDKSLLSFVCKEGQMECVTDAIPTSPRFRYAQTRGSDWNASQTLTAPRLQRGVNGFEFATLFKFITIPFEH